MIAAVFSSEAIEEVRSFLVLGEVFHNALPKQGLTLRGQDGSEVQGLTSAPPNQLSTTKSVLSQNNNGTH